VLARIVVERRLVRSRVGAVAIACAAVDNVTAWCIVAFVVSSVRSASLGAAIRTSLLALGYVAVMLFVLRPVLQRLADRTRLGLSQNLVAVLLVCLLGSSVVSELIGIHALFGAFCSARSCPKPAASPPRSRRSSKTSWWSCCCRCSSLTAGCARRSGFSIRPAPG
jgi:Kef-type K+ transport system membrane component KefB